MAVLLKTSTRCRNINFSISCCRKWRARAESETGTRHKGSLCWTEAEQLKVSWTKMCRKNREQIKHKEFIIQCPPCVSRIDPELIGVNRSRAEGEFVLKTVYTRCVSTDDWLRLCYFGWLKFEQCMYVHVCVCCLLLYLMSYKCV